MRFSIIIPVYNAEEYLQECIISLLSQTYKDFEIILINDGSTDRSGDVCESLKDRYKELSISVFHQQNSGQIEARYNGIRHATGEYCLFLDSDDTLESVALEKIYEVITMSGAEMIVFNGQRWLGSQKYPFWPEYSHVTKVYAEENLDKVRHDVIFTRRFNNIAFKAIKTATLKDSLDYTDVTFIREEEDLMMQLPVFDKITKVVYLPELLYNYRLNPTSTTGRYNIHRFKAKAYVLNERYRYSKKWGCVDFDITRLELLAQCVKRTLFLMRNIICDDFSMVRRELEEISTNDHFSELYQRRKEISCDAATRLSLFLVKNKAYASLYILIYLYRALKGKDRQVNTVLQQTFCDDRLNG